ncbi:MAG: hypothetical protein NW207_00145 [Cytophagales bacterium]|nr:hypothetical protein [Cytophagales bacterium]
MVRILIVICAIISFSSKSQDVLNLSIGKILIVSSIDGINSGLSIKINNKRYKLIGSADGVTTKVDTINLSNDSKIDFVLLDQYDDSFVISVLKSNGENYELIVVGDFISDESCGDLSNHHFFIVLKNTLYVNAIVKNKKVLNTKCTSIYTIRDLSMLKIQRIIKPD